MAKPIQYLSPDEFLSLLNKDGDHYLEPFSSIAECLAYVHFALISPKHDMVFRSIQDHSRCIWMAGHEEEMNQKLTQFYIPNVTSTPWMKSLRDVFIHQTKQIHSNIEDWSWMIDEFFAQLGFEKIKYIEHDIL